MKFLRQIFLLMLVVSFVIPTLADVPKNADNLAMYKGTGDKKSTCYLSVYYNNDNEVVAVKSITGASSFDTGSGVAFIKRPVNPTTLASEISELVDAKTQTLATINASSKQLFSGKPSKVLKVEDLQKPNPKFELKEAVVSGSANVFHHYETYKCKNMVLEFLDQ